MKIIALALALILTATACTTLKTDVVKVGTEVVDCVTGKATDPLCGVATIFAKWLAAPSAREESAPNGPNVAELGAAFKSANASGKVFHTLYGDVR